MLDAIGFGALRLDLTPSLLEGSARIRKIAGNPAVANAAVRRRVGRDGPLPLLGVDRDAGANANRSDVDVITEDQPVFGLPVLVSAADEGRHRP
jgi:hypothetical protein